MTEEDPATDRGSDTEPTSLVLRAYRGLETGDRLFSSYMVANGDVRFVLTSPLWSAVHAPASENISPSGLALLKEAHAHLERHSDAVKDVAFEVDDVEAPWTYSKSFDFIHCRSMGNAIRDWTKLLQQCFE